jgi:hypothetical protein
MKYKVQIIDECNKVKNYTVETNSFSQDKNLNNFMFC